MDAEGDVVQILLYQNTSIDDTFVDADDVKFRFLRRNRNDDLYNVVLEVSPAMRLTMLASARLNVEHQRVRVQDYSPFVQCFGVSPVWDTSKVSMSDVLMSSDCCSLCWTNEHNVQDMCVEVR